MPVYEQIAHNPAFIIFGFVLIGLITPIGIRMVAYWWSFYFYSGRYRFREDITTISLMRLPELPFIKVQWTTLGSPGSTEVIIRALRQLEELAAEAPEFYARFLSAEIVTENPEQAALIQQVFSASLLAQPTCIVTPPDYQTPRNTKLKAKQLHYMVELRRAGMNRKPGKTFIVHFDEDTLMVPREFRKMIWQLAHTDKSCLTGPIYYPLEYGQATKLARATEASRPITCFECRRVMETGEMLHIHGSNIVMEEEFENRVGWDIGQLDGQPFIAEDYMFGMKAFITEGKDSFGWHGCVALEQPPFSFPSVFRQRFRWVFGVLQGMSADTRLPEFKDLSWRLRMKVIWGTRYRIFTYGAGSLTGGLALLYMPAWLYVAAEKLHHGQSLNVPWYLAAWFSLVGIMWLGSNLVGAWLNTKDAGFMPAKQVAEITRAIVITPVAGMMENLAAVWAVTKWVTHHRTIEWKVTPSTKAADDETNGRTEIMTRPLAESVIEPPVPWEQAPAEGSTAAATGLILSAAIIVAAYIAMPVMIMTQDLITGPGPVLAPFMTGADIIAVMLAVIGAIIWRTSKTMRHVPQHALPPQTEQELDAILDDTDVFPAV
jgi:hypothetical protein